MFTAESASETSGRGAAGVSTQREPTMQVNDALCCDLRTRSWFPTRSRLEALWWAVGQSARRRRVPHVERISGMAPSRAVSLLRQTSSSACSPEPLSNLTD